MYNGLFSKTFVLNFVNQSIEINKLIGFFLSNVAYSKLLYLNCQ